MSSLRFRAALTTTSAVAWALCFGLKPSLWLGWVALVPFVLVLAAERTTSRQAAAMGLLHGLVYWLICIHWIGPTIRTFGHLPTPLAWLFLTLAALFLAPHTALFALAAHKMLGGQAVPADSEEIQEQPDLQTADSKRLLASLLAIACLPAFWVMTEWIRSNTLGSLSFPWNLAAYAWVDVSGALPLAAWIGAWGVSFLVVAVNVALALAWRRRSPLGATTSLFAALLVLCLAGRFSLPTESHFPERGHRMRLIQPNQTLQAEDEAVSRHQYAELLQLSLSECVSGEPTLIVWPESAAWPHTWEGSWLLRGDLTRLAQRGCSVLLNSATIDPAEANSYFNSAILVGPPTTDDPAMELDQTRESDASEAVLHGVYHKRFLVPWGEHVPLADIFPFIDKLARFAGRFSAGDQPGLLPWNHELLGLALCYEVIFPSAMVDQVRAGATVLVNISNDAWYGNTSAPRQLFRAARFRAAENRRPLLRVGLTGISGVIDARGAVRARIPLGQRGVLREQLLGGSHQAPYTRWPWIAVGISAILSALGLVLNKKTTLSR